VDAGEPMAAEGVPTASLDYRPRFPAGSTSYNRKLWMRG
jgi:hypothetical protein